MHPNELYKDPYEIYSERYQEGNTHYYMILRGPFTAGGEYYIVYVNVFDLDIEKNKLTTIVDNLVEVTDYEEAVHAYALIVNKYGKVDA